MAKLHEDEPEYESDPEDAPLSSLLRRKASDDECSDGEQVPVWRDARVRIGYDKEYDGQGRAPDKDEEKFEAEEDAEECDGEGRAPDKDEEKFEAEEDAEEYDVQGTAPDKDEKKFEAEEDAKEYDRQGTAPDKDEVKFEAEEVAEE